MIQAVKDLQRLREISSLVVRHGFGELLDRTPLWDLLGRREGGARPSPEELKATSARRFRELLAELGPTFIKLGQILSSRPDILPAQFVAELSLLQDQAAPMPLEVVLAGIAQGLGKPAGEAFEWVDPEPLASASIAQVHRARLKPKAGEPGPGEAVVVKVQRPNIRDRIQADTDLLVVLGRLLEGVIEETGVYTPSGIADEFRKAILTELDFENEARNLEIFARKHQGSTRVVVPRVHREVSSGTVLTLSELTGIKLADVLKDPSRTDVDRKALAQLVLEESCQQLFVDGIFHGDPHPGNVLVLPGNKLGLLDFGLVGKLSKGMQEAIVQLMLAIALRDSDTVVRLLYKIGVPDHRINLQRFRADVHDILDRYLGLKLSEVSSSTLLKELLDLAVTYRIKVPREYAVLSKAGATVEGTLRTLDPDLDVAEAVLPYAKQMLLDRYNPSSMSGGLLRGLLQLQGFLQDTPAQLSQILMDLEGGKFHVTIRSEELSRINTNLKSLGMLLFMGAIASALVIGGFGLAWRNPATGKLFWPWQSLVALALALVLFGTALLWTLVSGRIRKIRLRRWLR